MSAINKVFKTTMQANAILGKAGGVILKSSLNTAKQLASLYKDAGVKAFKLSKEVVTKTVELTIDNQKQVLKTSGKAIKEAAKSIRDQEPKLKTMTKKKVKSTRKTTPKRRNVKKEVTIDDLI